MTSNKQLTVVIGMVISFLSLSVYAQSAGPERNFFSADGISFEYPAGYSVSDESTTEAQQFIITRKGSSVQLTIVAPRRVVLASELPTAAENLAEPIVKTVALTLGETNSSERTSIQTFVGSTQAEGVLLRSSGNRHRTGEVIWLRLGSRLVAMAFVRSGMDEAVESELWETVRSSLKVAAPVIGSMVDRAAKTGNSISGGVLNGKALALPKPDYPDIARAAHASGTVVVQVLIDEEGNVISAHAVSGHPLLQAASVAAARQAKFSPTFLEGDPVRVTGVIQYNFVSQ
jgi:TonB family protein